MRIQILLLPCDIVLCVTVSTTESVQSRWIFVVVILVVWSGHLFTRSIVSVSHKIACVCVFCISSSIYDAAYYCQKKCVYWLQYDFNTVQPSHTTQFWLCTHKQLNQIEFIWKRTEINDYRFLDERVKERMSNLMVPHSSMVCSITIRFYRLIELTSILQAKKILITYGLIFFLIIIFFFLIFYHL